jgi:hypothetical protein
MGCSIKIWALVFYAIISLLRNAYCIRTDSTLHVHSQVHELVKEQTNENQKGKVRVPLTLSAKLA